MQFESERIPIKKIDLDAGYKNCCFFFALCISAMIQLQADVNPSVLTWREELLLIKACLIRQSLFFKRHAHFGTLNSSMQ